MECSQIPLFLESQRVMSEIIVNLAKENEMLRSQLEGTPQGGDEELFSRLDKLQHENSALETKNGVLNAELKAAEEVRAQMEAAFAEYRDQRDEELSRMQQVNEDLLKQLEANKEVTAVLEAKNAEIGGQLESMQQNLSNLAKEGRLTAAMFVDIVKTQPATEKGTLQRRKRAASAPEFSFEPELKRVRTEEDTATTEWEGFSIKAKENFNSEDLENAQRVLNYVAAIVEPDEQSQPGECAP